MSFTVEHRVAFPSSLLLDPPVSRKPRMQALLPAFLWSTGNGGGGGDAAGSLLLFPVLSELLSPLRWWAGAAGLQTCSSLYPCQEQPSSKVKLQLLPCPLAQTEQPVRGNRGMSYSNRFSRWQGKNNSYFHQRPPVSTRLPCPPADLQRAHLALLPLPSLPYR